MRLYGCPCGYYGDPVKQCTCPPAVISRYQRRISGPLLDRIDIFVEVPRLEYDKLMGEDRAEDSERVRQRVETGRRLQLERLAGTKLTCNADMGPAEVRRFCSVEASAQSLLQAAMRQLHLTARGFHRVLKVARTIADLEVSEAIRAHHLAEAIQYRPRERG